MTLSVIDTQSESFLNQNITTFPESPQRREGGGTMTRVGGNGEAVSTSHFLRNPNTNNRHEEIEQFRNRRVRQKSGKSVNNKQNVFQASDIRQIFAIILANESISSNVSRML